MAAIIFPLLGETVGPDGSIACVELGEHERQVMSVRRLRLTLLVIHVDVLASSSHVILRSPTASQAAPARLTAALMAIARCLFLRTSTSCISFLLPWRGSVLARVFRARLVRIRFAIRSVPPTTCRAPAQRRTVYRPQLM